MSKSDPNINQYRTTKTSRATSSTDPNTASSVASPPASTERGSRDSEIPKGRHQRLLESGARYDEDSPGQHYRSAGLSLIAIGSTIMFMAVWMYLIEREDTQQDHVSNMLVAALILVTGFSLKSHEHEDLD